MARLHHYRRNVKGDPELDVTTFLNLMVVLIPFLLITAVFSRMAIVELNLPSSSGGGSSDEPSFRVEVIVRETQLEVSDGSSIVATIPNVGEVYDLGTLSDHMVALKREHPESDNASVLLEPDIYYDHLIQVMDVVRSAQVYEDGAPEDAEPRLMPLFSSISIGDAP